jgi:hypothetical protein
LTQEQAQDVLRAFLSSGRATFESLEMDAISLDYSEESVIQAAHHIATKIESENLDKEQQNIWFMRLGYYFGEALRRAEPQLVWGIGDSEFAFANHPVLIGFPDKQEGPLITICRNMVGSVAEGTAPATRIDKGIKHWFNKLVS